MLELAGLHSIGKCKSRWEWRGRIHCISFTGIECSSQHSKTKRLKHTCRSSPIPGLSFDFQGERSLASGLVKPCKDQKETAEPSGAVIYTQNNLTALKHHVQPGQEVGCSCSKGEDQRKAKVIGLLKLC